MKPIDLVTSGPTGKARCVIYWWHKTTLDHCYQSFVLLVPLVLMTYSPDTLPIPKSVTYRERVETGPVNVSISGPCSDFLQEINKGRSLIS